MILFKHAGISCRRVLASICGSLQIVCVMPAKVSEAKGSLPVVNWYSIVPSENKSERPSTFSARICSGDI